MSWPFRSVLVANRGEIAVRILRTVKALGLEGVVVYHAADQGSPAVKMA
ncbi:MAG TPA: biotin carboxylase N-terminal domain-containing protein, partial [Verrucomicrobiae bacterium]|nr:biotin carboxylase N-terminal domain-containing protein [Verrucomicrobiae bacterium]